ncbi:Pentatricopeptide repeat-containing protein [Spatholobus suberectus]|nr:Pentatricopeptide repeat-containing protein [Spatholobus suberectus]
MRWSHIPQQQCALIFRSLLRRCARASALRPGEQLHAAATVAGILSSPSHFLLNAVLHLYCACSLPSHARKLFDQIPHSHKDSVDYTALIRCSHPLDSLRFFLQMRRRALPVDAVAFVCALGACARLGDSNLVHQMHVGVVKFGFLRDTKVCNGVMDGYVKCGLVGEAKRVFGEIEEPSVVSWTVLLEGVVKWEGVESGRVVFDGMPARNEVAWTVMIKGYVGSGFTREAFWLLREMVFGNQQGLGLAKKTSFLQRGELRFKSPREEVITFSVQQCLEQKEIAFDNQRELGLANEASLPQRGELRFESLQGEVFSFNTRQCFEQDCFRKKISEGNQIKEEMVFGCGFGFGLNCVTLCSVLSACSQSGDVSVGRWVHCYAVKAVGWDLGVMVGTSLVDMYAKCGRISAALMVFRHMPRRNVVAWNAMLGGLAMHGMGKVVVEMFGCMVEEVKPDAVTFLALLSACSHSGLVEQGWQYFHDLECVYGVRPEIEHYACMVDLLGRAGRLEEAEVLVRKMPIPPNEVVLGSLLGACYAHGKLRLGEKIMRELVQMDPLNTEYHILLSNMYALCGKVNKANSLRKVLKNRGIRKVPGMSSIYVDGQLHRFIAGDKSHPRTADIYTKLDDMIYKLRLAGYVPNTNCQVLFGCSNGDDCMEALEEVEQVLFTHSEKLALCFGLMNTPSGSPLCIFKNLRICQDCHSAIKIASDIYKREIVVRDRYRFHNFNQGSCSCSDYW